jgi:DNA-binding CsgD family transcriptional regulator
MGEAMNKQDIFRHLMKTDPVFRKKVITMAAEQGLALYNAAMECAPSVEKSQVKQVIDIREARRMKDKKSSGLTKKEQEVYELMHEHQNLTKVAKAMRANDHAVRYHIRNVFHKTGEDLLSLVGERIRLRKQTKPRGKGKPKPKGKGKGKPRTKANAKEKKSRYLDGSRDKALQRNGRLRDGILEALQSGPATVSDIRERMPKKTRDLILSPFMMGNAMTTLRAGNKIRCKGRGMKTTWRLAK